MPLSFDHPRVHALLLLLTLGLNTTAPADPPQDSFSVYLVTCGPGDDAWEKFGHNMIWFYDEQSLDEAYNWGMFDFDQKNFIWHFIQGKLWYWMAGYPSGILQQYVDQDRTLQAQELNLSLAQKQALLARCRENAREENRYYLYDYFTNNCSSKTRDAIDWAVHGQLRQQATTQPSDVTFRSESLRLGAESPWLYVCFDYVMGHPTDRQLSAWDEMFIPSRLHDRLASVTVTDDAGHTVPLVKREALLHGSKRLPLRVRPPNWLAWFALAGIAIGGALAGLSAGLQGRRWARWAFGLVAVAWCLLGTAASGILSFLWLFTNHAAVRPNENILQLSPWMIPLVVLIPLALSRRGKAVRIAAALAGASAACAGLGLLLKLFPGMTQPNADLIALALPANAGLAWALWRFKRCDSKAPFAPATSD